MILTPHILVGAAVGSQVSNPWLAFCLGLISHYLIDLIPHWEYITEANVSNLDHIKKIFLDFMIGVVLVWVLVWSDPDIMIILVGVMGSTLPDFLHGMYSNFGIKWLKYHYLFHHKVHALKRPSFWQGLPAMLLVIFAAFYVLLL